MDILAADCYLKEIDLLTYFDILTIWWSVVGINFRKLPSL